MPQQQQQGYYQSNDTPFKERFGRTEYGRLSEQNRMDLGREVMMSQEGITNQQYIDIVRDPQMARNDRERLAGLAAREVFILVDRSGSMTLPDNDPTGRHSRGWTRWDSARIAAQSIIELALCLDVDNRVQTVLWDSTNRGLRSVHETITQVHEIDSFFASYQPQGGTPLAEALTDTYDKWLHSLLMRSEPFTVVILTDGAPNDTRAVKEFFRRVIRENNLERPGRETLAAFSFVRMGDDPGAKRFLQDLDDNLIPQLNVRVDIVDAKSDNFLFGTDEYFGRSGVGPFALFWDALYD